MIDWNTIITRAMDLITAFVMTWLGYKYGRYKVNGKVGSDDKRN